MLHTYEEAMKYIETKREAGIRFDLVRMERLMEELNHPERRVKTIHVAGTNGKGSTVTFLRSILEKSGLFVGTFMTPVYEKIEDHIAINNTSMLKEDFVETLEDMKEAINTVERDLNESISEFELMAAMSLYYFSFKKPVDIAIIEAGMGGGHDATNVITPLVSIITNVAMDHHLFLGESLEEIAKEKAGVIKSGVAVVTGAEGIPLQIIQEKAVEKKAKVYASHEQFQFSTSVQDGVQTLSYEALYCKEKDISIGMLGNHQGKNAALAITAVTYLKQYYAMMVDSKHLREGLNKAYLSGRFEIVQKKPTIILDTAHNVEALQKTTQALEELYPTENKYILFAAMEDKEIEAMLNVLHGLTNRITITSFQYPRAANKSYYDALEITEVYEYIEDSKEWMLHWKKSADEEDVLLITGSNYFVDCLLNRS